MAFIEDVKSKLSSIGDAIVGWYTNPGETVKELNEEVMQPVYTKTATTASNIISQITSPLKNSLILVLVGMIAILFIMRKMKI